MVLKDRTAIITGAAQGIGEAIATAYARAGANVVLCDIRAERMSRVYCSIAEFGGRAMEYQGDVSSRSQMRGLFEEVRREYGVLHILVNNAGISPKQEFEEITESDWDRVIDTNLKSCFICSQLAFSMMKAQKNGRIINMSSAAGQMGGVASSVHYATSKAGILGITKALSRIAGPYNITVNAIAPGKIETELLRKGVPASLNEKIVRQIPLRRTGTVAEVAEVALFLASDAAAYISGECISVNGGWIRS